MKQKISTCSLSTMALATVLALAVGSQPAFADTTKYNKSEVRVTATKTKITAVKKQEPEKKEQRRPTIDADQFRLASATKVAKLTDAAIGKLKQLIEITEDDDPEKADYYFRLAEHYRDKKVIFSFQAREMDEKIFQAEDAAKERLKATQANYEKMSRDWMIKSIKMYLAIAQNDKWAKYNRMDEVLYNVADILNQAKRRDKARAFFSKLIRNYPQSKYIPDAYLSFAEFYFNDGQVENALKLYERVARYPDSPIYGYAVYKQGWCWLNLKDPRRALELFVQVIRNAHKWAGPKKGKIVLIKEARKDSVRAYAMVGTPEKAWPFFKRIGGDTAMSMLERLANMYFGQGKYGPSIRIFKQLISLQPKSKKICTWQYAILQSTLPGKDRRGHVQEARRLAAIYRAVEKRGDLGKTALAECRGNAAAVLRELATTWHNEAQKTQNDATYALAEHLYKEYLENFPKEKDAYEMNFYYSELLFKLKRWEAAAGAYTKVVTMGGKKYLNEAAYAAVISWKNALNVDAEIKDTESTMGKKPEQDKFKPKTIPPRQEKMMAAFDTYLKYVPKSKERVNIMYRKARIYYENNHFERAVKIFKNLVKEYAGHELAVYGENLLLDSLNVTKKFDQMEARLDSCLKNAPLLATAERVGDDLKGRCATLKGQIERKRVEQMQAEKRWRACGEGYAKLANKYQDDARWAELLYNAAICYEAAKLIGQAINARRTLIKVKPDDRLSQKAVLMIGQNYHALAWFSRAADYYEQFAKKYPGEKEAPDALQNAIVFRLGRGEYDKAKDDVSLYIKKYGPRKKFKSKVASAFFSLGSIYEAREDTAGLMKHYNSYLKTWGKAGGADREILAHMKIGSQLWKESCPNSGVNGACISLRRVRSKRTIKKRKKKKTLELRTQCGPETKMRVTVIKRNKAKAAAAQKHFSSALKIFKKSGKKAVRGQNEDEIARRRQEMRSAVAAARFYQAERILETFLEVGFPKDLDFSDKNKKKKKASEKKFTKYIGDKGKLLDQARKAYQEVIKQKQAHWAIAGAARIGQLFQNFSDALFTASVPTPTIPKQLRKREDKEEFLMAFTDAYCDALENQAVPLEKKAVQGLAKCLEKSTELSWYNEWSELCESELNQIAPSEYPLAAEIRAKPGYVFVRADRSRVIEDLK